MSDLYNVLKMQTDEAKALIKEQEQLGIDMHKKDGLDTQFLSDAENAFAESRNALDSLGITLNSELSKVEYRADAEVKEMLEEIENGIIFRTERRLHTRFW